MEVVRMKAERRSALGRNQIKKLRAEGWMPAVIYGAGAESMSIQISEWELEQHLKARHKVFALDVAGSPVSVFLQDVSFKATSDHPLHADFLRIDLEKPIHASLEVMLLGHPAGLGRGGSMVKDNLRIRVTALPTKLPEVLEVNVSPMNIGDVLRAGDLKLPESVELDVAADLSICHVVAPAATTPEPETPESDAPEPDKGDSGGGGEGDS